jgi:16S rRNA (uracil1498-N3)-methyltransferase
VRVKHRLYIRPPLAAGTTLTLDREKAHYLTRVLRLRPGEAVTCFDGEGHAWAATLLDATPREARLAVADLIAEAAPPEPRLHLVQALLKGASMDLVMQKSTELGATDLWPVTAERSQLPGDPARLDRKLAHWRRVVESAAEQCGALHMPTLHAPVPLPTWIAGPPDAALLLLDPGAPALPVDLPRAATAVLIGPEGGWTDAERQALEKAGARRFGLGERILRGETAPLAVLSALRHSWGWR